MIQALYICCYLEPLRLSTNEPITIYCDSQSALAIAERKRRQSFHSRFKHLNIHHLHIADNIDKGYIQPSYCPTTEMIADLRTKTLPAPTICYLKGLLKGIDQPAIVD